MNGADSFDGSTKINGSLVTLKITDRNFAKHYNANKIDNIITGDRGDGLYYIRAVWNYEGKIIIQTRNKDLYEKYKSLIFGYL